MAPANRPDIARNAISSGSPTANAQPICARPYRNRAKQATRILPKRSPSGPVTSCPSPYGSMNPATMIVAAATVMPSSAATSGSSGSSSRMPAPEANPAAASSEIGNFGAGRSNTSEGQFSPILARNPSSRNDSSLPARSPAAGVQR